MRLKIDDSEVSLEAAGPKSVGECVGRQGEPALKDTNMDVTSCWLCNRPGVDTSDFYCDMR